MSKNWKKKLRILTGNCSWLGSRYWAQPGTTTGCSLSSPTNAFLREETMLRCQCTTTLWLLHVYTFHLVNVNGLKRQNKRWLIRVQSWCENVVHTARKQAEKAVTAACIDGNDCLPTVHIVTRDITYIRTIWFIMTPAWTAESGKASDRCLSVVCLSASAAQIHPTLPAYTFLPFCPRADTLFWIVQSTS